MVFQPAHKDTYLGCDGLSVRFYSQERPVLHQLNLHIRQGEKVLILGPSGSGKSTLLSVLAGIIPEHVEAELEGDVYRQPACGVMFQDPDSQFCMLRVDEEIAFSLENRSVPREQMEPLIDRAMAQVGLNIPRHTPIETLSGGMKQRLALACLLALEPEVLFFDEPTAQLDPASRNEVFTLLRQLGAASGHTMVVVEHVLDGCIEWMERVILLDGHGRFIADGAPAEIITAYRQEMVEAGIWLPQLFPYHWDDVCNNPAHPLAVQLTQQLQQRLAQHSHMPQLQTDVRSTFTTTDAAVNTGVNGKANTMDNTKANTTENIKTNTRAKTMDNAFSNALPPLIQTEQLAIGYGRKAVMQGIDVAISPGQWIAIIGKNGSGKSTFLKSLLRLVPALSGRVHFHGKELRKWSDRELYARAGFVFQNPELQFVTDTVYDEIAFGGRQRGWSEQELEERTLPLLREFGLEGLREEHPFSLSLGQKRRLSVATMLLFDQELLLLDEPTFGQDARTAAELVGRLHRRQQEGTTIVMVTHDMELVDQYADRVLLFDGGQIAYDGDPPGLFLNEQLWQHSAIEAPLPYRLHLERKERHII